VRCSRAIDQPSYKNPTRVNVLPFPRCPAGGLTMADLVTLVNGLAGGQPGILVLVDGSAQQAQDRLWLRCYRPGVTPLSFGFSRHTGRIRVAVKGLERFGLMMTLQEPEFDTVAAALEAVRVVIQATMDLSGAS
jgi:hypothetical protein